MGDMLIRGVPDGLKTDITRAAGEAGESLSSKAIDLLRKGLVAEREAAARPKESAWHMLRSAFEVAGPLDGEYAKIMDEVEAERKRDFGRPVDFWDDDDPK